MGTEITLNVGGIALTYSKNDRGLDHGSLFQMRDRKPLRSDQLDYAYYESHGDDPTPDEMAFSRPLKRIAPRLHLLGFDLARVRREYERVANDWLQVRRCLADGDTQALPDLMVFEEFFQFVLDHPLESLDSSFNLSQEEALRGNLRERFPEAVLNRVPNYPSSVGWTYSERTFFGELINILHPYSVMRILSEGKANENISVIWQYGPLVGSGWATEQDFVPEARRSDTFLVATEGSSDIHVLSHALKLLRPDIVDFFRFIDVSESHPFAGTGNLIKFAEGLAKIDVQNQVLFLFDNDAEGLEAHQRLSKIAMHRNMRVAMLPELEVFRSFRAQGPEGIGSADINRRAAAIECYLDLNFGCHDPAEIRWTNYKKNAGAYHGALERKDVYVKEFLAQTDETIGRGVYDVSKIEAVLDLLVAECTGIAIGRDATYQW